MMSEHSQHPSSLPALATEALESLHQHRLLSTTQIQDLHLPGRSIRRTQELLKKLACSGLVAWAPGSGRLRLWYLTARGAAAVQAIVPAAGRRRRQVTPQQAAGPLRAHTLCVNELGVAFVRCARLRGDDCGPLSWRHEVALRLPSPQRRGGELVIADALLTYTQASEERSLVCHHRLIELDRATLPVQALVEKLSSYGRARRAWLAGEEHLLPDRFDRFPTILIALARSASADTAALQRRLSHVVAFQRASAEQDPAAAQLVLLDELKASGPFAQIFIDPSEPHAYVDWLGNPRGG
jgi:hypothetical protein